MTDHTANHQSWDLLLDRYIAGECSDDEAAAVRRWLRENTHSSAAAEEMQRLRSETGRYRVAGTEPALRALQARIAVQDTRRWSQWTQNTSKNTWRRLLPIAAAIVVTILTPSLYSVITHRIKNDVNSTPVNLATTSTLPGQRARLQLPDGSIVTLGVASTLRYNPKFGSESREVTLDGEAYFEVTSNTGKPFIINGSKAVMTVLGTSFSVRSYASDNFANVAVVDGKVAVRSLQQDANVNNGTVLTAGDVGTLTNNATTQITRPSNLAPYVAWKEGRLVFKNTPLSEVATQLERWYDVQITVEGDGLNTRPVTATFFEASFTPDVLDLFAESMGLRYKQAGRHITFSRR